MISNKSQKHSRWRILKEKSIDQGKFKKCAGTMVSAEKPSVKKRKISSNEGLNIQSKWFFKNVTFLNIWSARNITHSLLPFYLLFTSLDNNNWILRFYWQWFNNKWNIQLQIEFYQQLLIGSDISAQQLCHNQSCK